MCMVDTTSYIHETFIVVEFEWAEDELLAAVHASPDDFKFRMLNFHEEFLAMHYKMLYRL